MWLSFPPSPKRSSARSRDSSHGRGVIRLLCALPILATVFVFGSGCSDDPAEPGPIRIDLLTLHLGPSFLRALGETGVLFVSDHDGNLLDSATWSGETDIILSSNASRPDTVSLTTVSVIDASLWIGTELGIPVGTELTYDDPIVDPSPAEAEITFLNIPPCDYHRIASNAASIGDFGPPPSPFTVRFHGGVSDCAVRIDPVDAAPQGCWLRDLGPSGATTLDLAAPGAVSPLNRYAIAVPADCDYFEVDICRRYGPDIYHLDLDWRSFSGSTPDSVVVFGPEVALDESWTRLSCGYFGDNNVSYQQYTTGPVPDALTKLEGDFTIESTTVDNLVFSMTGSWDSFQFNFGGTDDANRHWTVVGRHPIRAFALPHLPQQVSEQHDDLSREDFALESALLQHAADDASGFSTDRIVWRHFLNQDLLHLPVSPNLAARIRPREGFLPLNGHH